MSYDIPTDTSDMWQFLEDNELANEEEMRLVTDITGYNVEAMESILYSRTGYNDFEQYIESELNDEQ